MMGIVTIWVFNNTFLVSLMRVAISEARLDSLQISKVWNLMLGYLIIEG